MKKIVLGILIGLFVSSCATFNPIPEGYSGPVANIEDTSSNDTGLSAHYFELSKINGNMISTSFNATRKKYSGQGTNFDPVMLNRDVVPEEAVFTIQGYKFFPTGAQALFSNDLMVKKDFIFTPEANKKYYIKGELSKELSQVWMEDENGNIIPASR